MAKETVERQVEEKQAEAPAEYTVTMQEFLSEIPLSKIETKAGFTRLCKKEAIGGKKLRSEWNRLFSLYETQPTKMTWAQWNKGGK